MFEKKLKKLFWALAGGRIRVGSTDDPPERSGSILILRPDRLGDFLLSAPALKAIEKKAERWYQLTIVAGVSNASLARALFPKAKVLVFRPFFLNRLVLFLKLWMSRFPFVVDFHSYPFSTTSALMSLLSGSPRRFGFWAGGDHKDFRALSQRVYNLGLKTPPENLHESLKSASLAHGLFPLMPPMKSLPLPLPIPIPSEVTGLVKDFYRTNGVTVKTKVIGIHPTLLKADNRWSQERYMELIGKLRAVSGLKIVVVHGQGEERELERFKELLEPLSNVFVLPSNDLFFILEAAKRFRVFVCNDSGLMHLAAGVTTLLAVFGPSDPRRWGPLLSKKFKQRIFRKKDGLCDSVRASEVAREALKAVKR
jgi:ADP-heptose:LPS heptosyltransferase